LPGRRWGAALGHDLARRLARSVLGRSRLGRSVLGRGALAAVLWLAPAAAQDFGSIDANGLPASGPAEDFFAVPSARSLHTLEVAAALRSTVLWEPISGAQPSPDPNGTNTAVVSALWLQEVLLGVGVGAGVELSLGLPIHALQSGQALSGVGIGDELAPVAIGDLRLGIDTEFTSGALRWGPRGLLYLPTGQEAEFAGERLPRGDVGLAAALGVEKWLFAGSLAARIRESSQVGNTRWLSQAVVALGARYAWSPAWDTSVELVLAPTLGEQPAPPSGNAGYLLPAEGLLGAHFRAQRFVVGAFVGTGLPASVASGSDRVARGPTSPLLRAGLEISVTF